MLPTVQRQGRAARNQPRIAAVLVLANVAFGVSTIYLARSLHAEDARNEASQAVVAMNALTSPPQSLDSTVTTSAVVAMQPDARRQGNQQPQPGSPSTSDASANPGLTPAEEARARKRIAELTDPLQRAQRIADMRAAIASRAEEWVGAMGLQPLEAERLLDIMAEASINNQLRVTRCQLRPGCDLRTEHRAYARSDLDDLARTFGPEGPRLFLDQEARWRVVEFSRNLPQEQSLTDDRAERLVEAFLAARQRWINTQDPVDALDKQLRDDAATILSEEQLAAFASGQRRYFELN